MAVAEAPLTHPPRSRSSGRLPDAHYQEVAAIWLTAWWHDHWPTTAVRDHYGVNYTTAARWVKRARQLGFLTQRYKRAHVCPTCGTHIECMRGEA